LNQKDWREKKEEKKEAAEKDDRRDAENGRGDGCERWK